MRVANADGRAVLVVDDGIVDIATASGGALPTDAQLLYERWDDVRALADRVQGPEAPVEPSALQAPVPRPRLDPPVVSDVVSDPTEVVVFWGVGRRAHRCLPPSPEDVFGHRTACR